MTPADVLRSEFPRCEIAFDAPDEAVAHLYSGAIRLDSGPVPPVLAVNLARHTSEWQWRARVSSPAIKANHLSDVRVRGDQPAYAVQCAMSSARSMLDVVAGMLSTAAPIPPNPFTAEDE